MACNAVRLQNIIEVFFFLFGLSIYTTYVLIDQSMPDPKKNIDQSMSYINIALL